MSAMLYKRVFAAEMFAVKIYVYKHIQVYTFINQIYSCIVVSWTNAEVLVLWVMVFVFSFMTKMFSYFTWSCIIIIQILFSWDFATDKYFTILNMSLLYFFIYSNATTCVWDGCHSSDHQRAFCRQHLAYEEAALAGESTWLVTLACHADLSGLIVTLAGQLPQDAVRCWLVLLTGHSMKLCGQGRLQVQKTGH